MMLKPPFTVIIIKKTHEPLTVQVTYRLVITVFLLLSLFITGAGLGIPILLSKVHIPYSTQLFQGKFQGGSGAQESPADAVSGKVRLVNKDAQPGVGNLTISHAGQNKTGIDFSLSPVDSCETMYVWLIINPDALPGDETAIYPRNPMYRGIPVDYRNGLEFHPSTGSRVSIDISGLISETEFRTFKILAYSPDGKVLVNSVYEVTQGPGAS